MTFAHRVETLAVHVLSAGFTILGSRAARATGAALGAACERLGLRARVARENLEHAFPERSEQERAHILSAHYRELGRVVAEYPRLDQMARAPAGEQVVEIEGLEHLEAARTAGRGAILLSGHYGFFEMTGAFLGQIHPVSFVVRPMSNPGVDAWIRDLRRRAGVQSIDAGSEVRAIYEKLRDNEWVAMLADQDARRQGVFVPFMGRLASTPLGPARIAVATGAPIIMGRAVRRADGRHDLRIEPALEVGDPKAPEAALRLTTRHVVVLERWVRERPELWFWLHRRWKTRPAEEGRRASV